MTPTAIDRSLWEEARPPLHLPRLSGRAVADVCVVGLGGSGLSAILESLEIGRTVVGIDARQVAAGAAGRNGGFLLAGTAAFYHEAVRRYGRARARRLYEMTLAEIERFLREAPALVRRTGSLRIAASPEELQDCRLQFDAMREDELPVEIYEGLEGSGLLMPSDAVFDPLGRCQALARWCLDGGGQLFEATTAESIARGEVRTPGGQIACESVVVAVDGRIERILPELGQFVRTARLQMIGTAPTKEVSLPRPVYTRWGFDYWQQLPDGRIVLGGLRDRFEQAEWTPADGISAEVQEALEHYLRHRLRVHAPITHRWAASAGYTSSGLPFLGEVRPGVWATGGYSGTGNLMGSLWGRAAARMAAGEAPDAALVLQ